MQKKRIAIFASGTGSNALNIIDHFKNHPKIEVGVVITNRKEAPVVENAKSKGVEVVCLDNNEVADAAVLNRICVERGIHYIVLAGYLRKIPAGFIHQYEERILNIHPALLPKYGGQGMYGDKVHEAIKLNNETETGITIHFVNEHFDEGRIIAQFHCPVFPEDSVESIRDKVQRLEHQHFPFVIEQTILSSF